MNKVSKAWAYLHPNFKKRFRWGLVGVLPSSLIDVFSTLIVVATLGYYHPGWGGKYMTWIAKREIKREMRKQSGKNHE